MPQPLRQRPLSEYEAHRALGVSPATFKAPSALSDAQLGMLSSCSGSAPTRQPDKIAVCAKCGPRILPPTLHRQPHVWTPAHDNDTQEA